MKIKKQENYTACSYYSEDFKRYSFGEFHSLTRKAGTPIWIVKLECQFKREILIFKNGFKFEGILPRYVQILKNCMKQGV